MTRIAAGAGKSTTISCLCGMIQATSGSASMYGMNLRTQLNGIRRSMGVCPQFDILWPDLTVAEHVNLVCAIKGIPRSEWLAEAERCLTQVDLHEKLTCRTKALSGGQKRKLSVALAFIGAPRIVFLDEPTSGMDPYARRLTWEVIKANKANRVIVLTTHFMDEADVLSDRVCIVNSGKLLCAGTSMFLKKRFGIGYLLTIIKNVDADVHALTDLVRSHVNGSFLATNVASEVSYKLPTEEAASFAPLLRELQNQQEGLGILGYGLSCSTLEEVFLATATKPAAGPDQDTALGVPPTEVGTPTGANPDGDCTEIHMPLLGEQSHGSRGDAAADTDSISTPRGLRSIVGSVLVQQAVSQCSKRLFNVRRDWKAITCILIMPTLFIVPALWLAHVQSNKSSDDSQQANTDSIRIARHSLLNNRPVLVGGSQSPADLEHLINFYPNNKYRYTQPLSSTICDGTLDCNCWILYDPDGDSVDARLHCEEANAQGTIDAAYLDEIPINEPCYLYGLCDALFVQSVMALAPRDETNGSSTVSPVWNASLGYTVLPSATAVYGVLVGLNDVHNAIFRYLCSLQNRSPRPEDCRVTVDRKTLSATDLSTSNDDDDDDGSADDDLSDAAQIYLDTSLFIVLGGSILSAYFVVFPVFEVRSNSKHLQLVSGVRRSVFWLVALATDLMLFSVALVGIICLFAAYRLDVLETPSGGLAALTLLLMLFGWAVIPMAYLVHRVFTTEMGALAVVLMGYIVLGCGTVVTDTILTVPGATSNMRDIYGTTHWIFALVPHYCLGFGTYQILYNGEAAKQVAPEQCAANICHWAIDWSQGLLQPQLIKCPCYHDPFDWKVVGWAYLYLALEGIVCFLATLLLEFNQDHLRSVLARKYRAKSLPGDGAGNQASRKSPQTSEDEDVLRERKRVQAGEAHVTDALVIDGLSKVYRGSPPHTAVHPLHLGLAPAQCFGLLGVNGAGKTTLFKMLSGEVAPSSGDAWFRRRGPLPDHSKGGEVTDDDDMYQSITQDLSACRQLMGYCPQFDGLQPNMTVNEHLHFYARTRGVPTPERQELVTQLLHKLGLDKYRHRLARACSGGNKRKLSVAIAMIGNPPVMLLDEPSSGMDPEARRLLWDVIASTVSKSGGPCIVLTSHSMEECEALCDRLSIQVSGRILALGSPQHLKNRFSMGYELTVRVKSSDGVDKVRQLIEEQLEAVFLPEVAASITLLRLCHIKAGNTDPHAIV
mmetsp:Transcript_6132/g.22524  ORF Transcript_6132/g.22524 Transcript_6132/m.22524 type:complete len:1227 (-) Transcript_6132:417-4097(-)